MMYGVLDIGTTGVKVFIYDKEGVLKYFHKTPLGFTKTKANYIEQDSNRLWEIIIAYLKKFRNESVRYVGVSTYRASVLIWNGNGKPLTNIVTWIDRRGADVLNKLSLHLKFLSKFPNLKPIFSFDSPTILYKWFLMNDPKLKNMIKNGKAYFGTLDSYIAYKLTGKYVTDATNAALTGLIHPKTLKPIKIINSLLDLPEYIPRIVSNTEFLGEIEGMAINVLIGDQQAAILAEGCLKKGCIKITNGTGSFVDMVLSGFKMPKKGLIPIIVVKTDNSMIYGIEGYLPSSGIVLDWMINKGFIKKYEDICDDSLSIQNPLFLPTFRGLRIPRYLASTSIILGLSLKNDNLDLARGFINGVAFLIQEILHEMIWQFKYRPNVIYANGGLSRCNKLVQAIADYTGFHIARPHDIEASGKGVLKLLEVTSGKSSLKDISEPEKEIDLYTPSISEADRVEITKKWRYILKQLQKTDLLRSI